MQSQKHDAVFDVTPDYMKISVLPGKCGKKVVELLPLREEVVVNVMKLPVNVEFQKGVGKILRMESSTGIPSTSRRKRILRQ